MSWAAHHARVVSDAAAQLAAHAAAADPHSPYQARSEKGAANGYASLSSGILVPIAQLPVGTGASQVAAGNHTHATAAALPALVFSGGDLLTTLATNIGTATWGDLPFAEDYDPNGMHSDVSSAERITIPPGLSGKYLFHAVVQCGNGSLAGTYRRARLAKNNVGVASFTSAIGQGSPAIPVAGGLTLVAGDYITIQTQQDSGVSQYSVLSNIVVWRLS